jgi:pimeloyl-ACP methyl ester carboxylesterase
MRGPSQRPTVRRADMWRRGACIHYRRTGTTGAPSLILVHGFGDSGLSLCRVAHALQHEFDMS